jgi:hypothetical protein
MSHASMGERFKPKIALQNLRDGLRRYAEMFGHLVCGYEREFVEKGAQASEMSITGRPVAIIDEDPRYFYMNAPDSEPFHPEKFDHESLFGFFQKVTLTYSS